MLCEWTFIVWSNISNDNIIRNSKGPLFVLVCAAHIQKDHFSKIEYNMKYMIGESSKKWEEYCPIIRLCNNWILNV